MYNLFFVNAKRKKPKPSEEGNAENKTHIQFNENQNEKKKI